MFLIAGLGNPGREYECTRHNIGFEALDYLADSFKIKMNKLKFKAIYGAGIIAEQKVVLIKPSTYMNLSGESVGEFVRFYKLPITNVIIVHDDIALNIGALRIREKGSDGGHNGIKNILYQLQDENFIRVKIGVGYPDNPQMDVKDYVLGRFTTDEIRTLEDTIRTLDKAIPSIILEGAQKAMSRYNSNNRRTV